MIVISNGAHTIKRKIISQGIQYWRKVRNLSLKELLYRINCEEYSNVLTNCTEEYIKKVINCEPVDIPLGFLQTIVMVLNPPSGRKLSIEDTSDILTLEDCLGQLEVPAPRQEKLFG